MRRCAQSNLRPAWWPAKASREPAGRRESCRDLRRLASAGVHNERVADQAVLRDRDATARFFDGLDLVGPGVVAVSKWRPDSDKEAARASSMWCGVARKP